MTAHRMDQTPVDADAGLRLRRFPTASCAAERLRDWSPTAACRMIRSALGISAQLAGDVQSAVRMVPVPSQRPGASAACDRLCGPTEAAAGAGPGGAVGEGAAIAKSATGTDDQPRTASPSRGSIRGQAVDCRSRGDHTRVPPSHWKRSVRRSRQSVETRLGTAVAHTAQAHGRPLDCGMARSVAATLSAAPGIGDERSHGCLGRACSSADHSGRHALASLAGPESTDTGWPAASMAASTGPIARRARRWRGANRCSPALAQGASPPDGSPDKKSPRARPCTGAFCRRCAGRHATAGGTRAVG